MNMEREKLQYQLEHARANYWIFTVFCGILLALTINKIRFFEFDGITVCYVSLFALVGYATLKLSEYIKNLKEKMN
ncbi:hypothetical protein CCZ37_00895 [Vibrio qinghaiensis]|uniref:Uncharacterized protein n=1 Tax=Vibrio qinghaiensis TaxID=2025808 RepID=A0A223MUL3_9VIBR|nr:hypothetical protein [Vibrio qinghaiensis]ASU21272.1 hypothetical protein CCZ37_00895 [Vibrio qinghaiensis]